LEPKAARHRAARQVTKRGTRELTGNDGLDKAGNIFRGQHCVVQVVSGKPTGRRVSPSADAVVIFDDDVDGSAKFVNIYKRGSSTPLAVFRYVYRNKIELTPEDSLKRDTWYTGQGFSIGGAASLWS